MTNAIAHSNNKMNALVCLLLSLSGVGCIGYATQRVPELQGQRVDEQGQIQQLYQLKPSPMAFPVGVVGVGALAGAIAFARQSGVSLGDLSSLADDVTALVKKQSKPLGERLLSKVVSLKVIPSPVKGAIARFTDDVQEVDWFAEFVSRSMYVVGRSGSGKTTFLLFLLYYFVGEFKGHVNIVLCDPHYGAPDDAGNINSWFDLPPAQFIRDSFDSIYASIDHEVSVLNQRKKQASDAAKRGAHTPVKFEPRFILVDEFIALMNEAKTLDELDQGTPKAKYQANLKRSIQLLLVEGRKYKIFAVVASQDFAVGSTGLTTDMIRNFNVILLGQSAAVADNVRYIPDISSSAEWIEKIKTARAAGLTYSAIVSTQSGCKIKTVPMFKASEVKIQLNPKNTTELWWDALLEREGFSEWLWGHAEKQSSLKAVLDGIKSEWGESIGGYSKGKPKYDLLSEVFSQMKGEVN
jgi:hypothetical protein